MDDPPRLDIDGDLRRTLEDILPFPIYELVVRAQALYGEIEPEYPDFRFPPAIPGNDWVPLPDDRCDGWSNIDSADPGELIHVALFVRPDAAINRIGALGACVYADSHDEYITIGEVIDAVPDESALAADLEETLLERFLEQLFDAIEAVATDIGDPKDSVIHCYTFSDNEKESLAEGLERHRDNLPRARALRGLWSLDEDGHTVLDQSMVTPIQPVVNEHFALQYPSQGLLTVTEQFIPEWTVDSVDPLDARANGPPLRAIFREQFFTERVPYLDVDPGIRLHLEWGPSPRGRPATRARRVPGKPDSLWNRWTTR